MLTDPNVVLYSIILSGLLSMSVMQDIQRETCGCQVPSAMKNQSFQEVPSQGLLASGNMNVIVSFIPVPSEDGTAT